MLSLFRLIVILLALPFLTATATIDLSPVDPGVTAPHASLSIAEIKHVATPVRFNFSQVKRGTAELEDGPEGEEAPLANLVRGYDGDDQIESSFGFAIIAFAFCTRAPNLSRTSLSPRHSVCAGFPTGPPTV